MIAAYVRVSKDEIGINKDDKTSNSIENQIKLINAFVINQKLGSIKIFKDDGYTGTDFNRPAFVNMITEIKQHNINCVIVKDLSRLGRDYISTGYLIEQFFPSYNVRFIAINDNVDSVKDENDLIAFKNIFNDWYAKDISKKIRSAKYARAINGQRINKTPPYGYMCTDDIDFSLTPNTSQAKIVKLIYEMYSTGESVRTIINILEKMKIPTPSYEKKHKTKPNNTLSDIEKNNYSPYHWNPKTIYDILNREEYIGNISSLKRRRISYKNHKQIPNNPENILKFKKVHEPIISIELWNAVQNRLKNHLK